MNLRKPKRKDRIEFSTMQRLADRGLLQGYTYHGMWLTINTLKDLIDARTYLKYEHGKYEYQLRKRPQITG